VTARRPEDGTVTAFVVTFMIALLAAVGLVLDGGMILAARRQAINEAEAAARAGAQAIDPGSLRSGSAPALDPATAQTDVQEYLASTGHSGTAQVKGDAVTVHVTFTRSMSILGILDLQSVTIRGGATAHAAQGVTREGG
jgi:hypothetical protein